MDLGLKDKVVVCMSSASGFGKGIATVFAREGAKVVICTSEAFKAELDQAVVDIEKETERLKKEEDRLTKELARVNGMLANEKFVSKAPQAKIDEEKAKLQKYTEMMEQVKTRLAQLGK